MSFGNPYLLLTLLVIPVAILFYVLAERRRMRYAVAFTNLGVLAAVARRAPAWRRLLPFGVFLLAVAALCVAVARPHRTTSVAKDRATVILVVDVSGSMQARDVKPTRLGAAQAAVRTFLKRVPKNVRVGLIAFAGEADVAAPPTTDRQMVLDSVDALGGFSGFGGTAIGDALSAAVDLGKASLAGSLAASTNTPTKGLVSVLFLSDGAQNRGVLLPIQGAELARQAGIPVYTVALGTPNGSLPSGQFGGGPPGIFGGGGGGGRRLVPPDPATLRQIAEVTNGEFFNARSSRALQSAYKRLGSQLGRTRAKTEITYEFVGLAALLLMIAGGLSALWAPRLP